MTIQLRYLAVVLLAALAVIGGRRLLYSQVVPPPAPIQSPLARAFLVILGVGNKTDTTWDGSITVTGSTVLSLRPWRFSGPDSISGTTSWKMATRTSTSPPGATAGVQENGVIVKIANVAAPVTFDVQTAQGNFSFSSQDFTFGVSKPFLNGQALVVETAAPQQLTTDNEEEDFPSLAQSGDDIYLAYTQFVHGDRSLATAIGTATPITDFTFLARPPGGDQVLFLHYSKSQRVWTGPFPVTGTGEDLMRTAVAVDGQGRAWIFYSAQRSGNFDIYARNARANGAVSPEIRLTSDPGTDLFPVATTDAAGRVWVAWQGFRDNNLEVLAAAQTGDTFTNETTVSTSTSSDWDPAIAAAPDGEVAISWDTYDKGDYDVYLRRVKFTDQIGLDDPIPIAATLNFEARSSLAYDSQNRLWIAWEISGPKWGKDYGVYETTGIALYQNHTIQVRCLIGNDLYATQNDVATVLPGSPARQLFMPAFKGPFPVQPDPAMAQNRQPNGDPVFGTTEFWGPKNSFPRLATDPDGTVYLAFREPAGSALSSSHATGGFGIGSIWIGAMVYFDGGQWHGPVVLDHSDALGDNRPAILALASGRLLMAQSTDHRLSPLPNGTPQVDGVNSDLFALELPINRTQKSPQLQRIGQVTPADPDPAAAAEVASAALNQSYRPTVNGQPLQLVRGDFHRHSEISWDGHVDAPLIDSYRYFIDAAALGWVGCCDHANGEAREYTWWLIQKFADAYLLGSKFVPMFYYERSLNYPEGHRNILFAQRGVRVLPTLPTVAADSPPTPAPDTNMLYAYLHFFGGISAPHTSATTQGTDWRNNDPEVEPFVEIYQGARQDYEMPGAPRANSPTDSLAGFEDKGYISNALGKGYQLAFEASSDHISTHMSFTNIWVTTPTRLGVLDAMHKRRLYGSTDYILADFRSGTHFMGESFTTTTPPSFSVKLWGTSPFQNISVIKNNNVVFSTNGDQEVALTWQDTAAQRGTTSYYYVRGLQTNQQIVWVSPMWVTLQ